MYTKQPRKEVKNCKNGRKNNAAFSFGGENVVEFNYKYSSIKTTDLVKPRTPNQNKFVAHMRNYKFTFGLGMAGCGKTLLSLYEGVRCINNPDVAINKIYYIRANIDGVDEEVEIGSLPGELGDKLTPLSAPIYDSCREFMTDNDAKALFDFGKIEVLPTAYLRGRSFANAFVIVDEAQNLTKGKIKTALTRLSHDSRMVFIGDPEQCDLLKDQKAFITAARILYEDEDVGVVRFGKEDCLRDDSLARIVEKLNNSW
jgi:phosphate starvation-inducible PhoH-like protein